MEDTVRVNDPRERNGQTERVYPFGDTLSDEMLIAAMAGGDMEAMELLYQRYIRLLYSLAYRMVAEHQVAEDIIQDSFLSIWRRASSYSPGAGAVRSWLISIVHHRTIDYLRSVQRRSVLKEAPLEETEVDQHTSVPDVWDDAWRSAQSTHVRAALMLIPAEQRTVIELAYFQGLTHTKIAERCQIPLGTVKARIRLGMLHLKQELEQMGISEL